MNKPASTTQSAIRAILAQPAMTPSSPNPVFKEEAKKAPASEEFRAEQTLPPPTFATIPAVEPVAPPALPARPSFVSRDIEPPTEAEKFAWANNLQAGEQKIVELLLTYESKEDVEELIVHARRLLLLLPYRKEAE